MNSIGTNKPTALLEYADAAVKVVANLSAIIGQFVNLTRKGRFWRGLCPFHNGKLPGL